MWSNLNERVTASWTRTRRLRGSASSTDGTFGRSDSETISSTAASAKTRPMIEAGSITARSSSASASRRAARSA